VRVRILKHSQCVIDGVSLASLSPGLTYEVPPTLGSWLVARTVAEEDLTPTVAIVIPISEVSAVLTGGISVSAPIDRGEDRLRGPKQRKKA
jgi:hypothetical protein